MKLAVMEGSYAVYRLPPESVPPAWVFANPCFKSSSFCSVTRTSEELSIVCLQDAVSDSNTREVDDGSAKIELDWSLLKVQGPLEFSMTGVLASLSSCLANADVSIFAVSTYDTDYLLVKSVDLNRAVLALQASGHEFQAATADAQLPRDGPAVDFEIDPLVAILVEGTGNNHPVVPRFNLALTTGWPPDESFREHYHRFCEAVDRCWESSDRTGSHAPVYLYPFEHLHATAATFVRPEVEDVVPEEQQETLRSVWSVVVRTASEDREWPTEPLSLRIDKAQIGTRAGILLWKDETGGMEAIRQCLRTSCQTHSALFEENGLRADTMNIPTIIHSTFLRFYAEPATPGTDVQRRFQQHVQQHIHTLIPEPFLVPIATFVCERTPYMHIPFDSSHVYASLFFTEDATRRATSDVDTALRELQLLKQS